MLSAAKKRRSTPQALELVLPATSANLGPAFDAAALALNLFIKIRAQIANEFSLVVKGRDRDICGRRENNLIISTYREVLQAEGKFAQPLMLEIENEIPIGKGCGSSAAARLAGIALAVYFGKLRWNDAHIVGEASRREHHPDNAAACWMGGITVAKMSGPAEAQIAHIAPNGKWPLLLAVPETSLSTDSARKALPEIYSRADAVTNIQNSMMLLAAFSQGRHDLLSSALEDRMHEPYRATLCELLEPLKRLPADSGTLGVALSGAGPSVIIFLDGKARLSRAKLNIRNYLASSNLFPELIEASISIRGASKRGNWKQRKS
ncbi:MAG: homoserine kinase [Acidobacteriota bacterium]|nr:homoserine kinase [Acidobacteriota bacterium]